MTATTPEERNKQTLGRMFTEVMGQIVLCDELTDMLAGAPKDRDLGSRT